MTVAGSGKRERARASIDLTTGDRTELSGANVGSGPSFVLPEAVAVHASGNPIWVIDSFASGLFEVDRSTGTRTIIADNSSTGSGPTFSLGTLDYDGTSLIVAGSSSVLAIDPATGNRTTLSSPTVGSGPQLAGNRLALDPTGNTIYSLFNGRVTSVDKATGNRTVLADYDVGRGPMSSYGFIDVGPDGIIWLAGDAGYSIGAMDPVTGDRVVAAK